MPMMCSTSPRHSMAGSTGEEDDMCWICLEGPSSSKPLDRPCQCPRSVHLQCLSRWCLQQAGRSEERLCRFCKYELPDWKSVLTPPQLQPADPVMVVTLGDVVHRVRVRPGEEGQRQFQQEIRRLFQIPDEVEFEVTFRCRAPCTTDTIQLEGMSSYDAATHCASLMAAQRLQAHGSGSTSVAAGAAAAAGAGAPAPAAPTSSTSSSSHGSSGGPAQQHHHHHPHGAPATPGMHVQAYSPAHAPSAAIATPLATCQPSGCPQPPPTPFHAHHQQQLQQPPQSAFLYAQQQGELAAAAQAQPVLHYSHPAHCGTPIAAPASSLGHPTLRRSPRNHHTPTPIASQCS